MKKLLSGFIGVGLLLFTTSCGSSDVEFSDTVRSDLPNNLNPTEQTTEAPVPAAPTLSVQAFSNDTMGWGYDILANGEPMIHQPHIPAIAGNIAFSSESDAITIGQLMVTKIETGGMPPSVKTSELDELGIDY